MRITSRRLYKKVLYLVLVPPNYGLYEKCSAAFMDILREYSDIVEPFSVDEAFVDMTASCRLFGEPVEVAGRIKDHIREKLGFTVNVGVSSNKLLAKMASDFKKPDMVHTLYPEEIQRKMWPLPVSALFFVGRVTSKKLFNDVRWHIQRKTDDGLQQGDDRLRGGWIYMAFGIGTNTQKGDAGPVKGKQREIGVQCWFSSKGKVIPLFTNSA